MKNGVEQLCN